MSTQLKINNKAFIRYKFLNSLFFGIAIGSYVTQYEPLKIIDFPIMGIIFSLLAIPIAMLYTRIMTMNYFFKFSLLVEVIMLIWIIAFLINPYSYQIALLIYIARQITFLFGDFLGRAETLFIKKTEILSSIDVAKQLGAISGMIISVIFYKILENKFLITSNEQQVFYVHFILCLIEFIIILSLFTAFQRSKN